MNDLFYANVFFVTGSICALMIIFMCTVILAYAIDLYKSFSEILESAKKTSNKIQNTTNEFLDSVQHHSEKVANFLAVINSVIGLKHKKPMTSKKITKAIATKVMSAKVAGVGKQKSKATVKKSK